MSPRLPLVLVAVLLTAGCLGSGDAVVSKEVDLNEGGYSVDGFDVSGETTVSYNTSSQDRAAYDVCIFPEDQLSRFKAGLGVDGQACNEQVRRAADRVTLPPGAYYFGVRCADEDRGCLIDIEVMADEPWG